MKNLFKKLAAFSILSIILISINAMAAFADGDSEKALELSKLLEDTPYETYCIKEKDEAGTGEGVDAKYIITIVEEPLSLENSGEGSDFITRICYRNTVSYIYNSEHKTVPLLLNKCLEKIANFDPKSYPENFNATASCKPVQVYLSKGGTVMIEKYISTIYKWAASMVGIIAVVVIIISGVQISIAGGDTQGLENAKGRIVKSLIGIAVLFLSGLILYTINPTFFTK